MELATVVLRSPGPPLVLLGGRRTRDKQELGWCTRSPRSFVCSPCVPQKQTHTQSGFSARSFVVCSESASAPLFLRACPPCWCGWVSPPPPATPAHPTQPDTGLIPCTHTAQRGVIIGAPSISVSSFSALMTSCHRGPGPGRGAAGTPRCFLSSTICCG